MPASLKLNRYRSCRPVNSKENRTGGQLKPNNTKCSSTIRIIKVLSAILVPLLIGAFTIITTLQESKRAELDRVADTRKIERQAQLQHDAEIRQRAVDTLKIKEQQEHDDNNAKETRIQNIYDTFMKDMSPMVLKDNTSLTIPEMIYVRAKTSLTLEQIDPRRKWYLIKFLYDSQLLYGNKSGMRYIDLAGVDLTNVKFGAERKFTKEVSLQGIRLSRLQLRNCSFEHIALHQANFEYSALNHSSFYFVSVYGANFRETILENTKLVLLQLKESIFKNSNLKFSIWSSASLTQSVVLENSDYSNSDLSEAIFQDMTIRPTVNFAQTNFQRTNFFNIKFSSGLVFKNLNMQMSKFIQSEFIDVKFIHCNMVGVVFERSLFQNVVFDHVDLQQSNIHVEHDSTKFEFKNVNLLHSIFNVDDKKISAIIDSILPNGTFKTSFVRFGMNLIENGDAEQGLCYYSNHTSLSISPRRWIRQGNITQMYYITNDWTRIVTNYSSDWQSCFFSSNNNDWDYSLNRQDSTMRQEINIEKLLIFINSRQVRYHASAFLGGFNNENSTTVMKILFKTLQNKTISTTVGSVSNTDRQNRTAMVYRSITGIIPSNTISVGFELSFHRNRQNIVRFGMADNLRFIIQSNNQTIR